MASRRALAEHLREIATLSETLGENSYKVSAFRNAAQNIVDNQDVHPTEVKGVGKSIKDIILDFKKTGTSGKHKALTIRANALNIRVENVITITAIRGIGPKSAANFMAMGITTVQDVITAAERGEIPERFIKPAQLALRSGKRKPRQGVVSTILPLIALLKKMNEEGVIERSAPAGSLRRHKEFLKDVDILIQANPEKVNDARFLLLTFLRRQGEVIAEGDKKIRALIPYMDAGDELQIDLLFTKKESWGAAMNYFTGSKEHNISLRALAVERGFTVNEYGIYRGKTKVAGEREEDLYEILGVPFHPPWAREGRYYTTRTPKKITPIFDAHIHTRASDGTGTIEEMAEAAKVQGLRGFLVSDHGGNAFNGAKLMTSAAVRKYIGYVKRVTDKAFSPLVGMEVDVGGDGVPLLPSEMWPAMRELDVITLACHLQHDVDITKRFFKAIRFVRKELNFYNTIIIAHPTGYYHGRRDHAQEDWYYFFACLSRAPDVVLEINGQPTRMDMNTKFAYEAARAGCQISLGSDAHSPEQIRFVKDSGWIASRAGVPPRQIWTPRLK